MDISMDNISMDIIAYDVPPQIIEIDAVGAIAVLFENLSLIP